MNSDLKQYLNPILETIKQGIINTQEQINQRLKGILGTAPESPDDDDVFSLSQDDLDSILSDAA